MILFEIFLATNMKLSSSDLKLTYYHKNRVSQTISERNCQSNLPFLCFCLLLGYETPISKYKISNQH